MSFIPLNFSPVSFFSAELISGELCSGELFAAAQFGHHSLPPPPAHPLSLGEKALWQKNLLQSPCPVLRTIPRCDNRCSGKAAGVWQEQCPPEPRVCALQTPLFSRCRQRTKVGARLVSKLRRSSVPESQGQQRKASFFGANV